MKRTVKFAIKTRDEKGIPHFMPCDKAYAKALIKGSCVTAYWRGQSTTGASPRYLRLANGCVVCVDMLNAKQKAYWGY